MSRTLSLTVALVLCSCLLIPAAAIAGGLTYTAYNMWYEVPKRMWALNYKRGTMLPAGTLVKDVTLFKEKYSPHQYISFKRVSDNQTFKVFFRRKFHPGKTLEDYRDFMFSNKNFEEQTVNMSKREVDAILRGVLLTGMSKDAVKKSYGIPPQHKTPNLQANMWRYWTSRIVTKDICFNSSGKTIHCNTNETL
ncbi:MAG: hypothetical protein B6I36_10665 [Desulfobacteraceae bacterium 4572_35.1]|nr:MAG: hypothetical protein B6I36_10665 [Desulfobacteraceae bacterium 4572_35.1]